MKLAYKAYDSLGKTVSGTIECEDATTATETLRHNGLFVAELGQSGATPARTERQPILRLGRGRRIKDVAVFARQLCVLVSSGTQLVDALSALERQAKPGRWRDTIVAVRGRIEEGAPLSEAMKAHSDYFDSTCYSLTEAGESSGQLVEMFDRLAGLKQKQLRVRNSVIGALIYPSLLVVLALGIFSMLLTFVVPKFAMLFKTLDVPLPTSTLVLVRVSAVFRSFWWVAALLMIAGAVSAFLYLRTPKGKRFRDTAMLKLPYVGSISRSLATARIVRLLGVLMGSHVPVLEALGLVKSAAGNIHYAELVSKAEDYVSRGEPINEAFSDATLVSPSIHEAIRSGEQSGQLDSLLLNIADFMDDENEVIVRSLTSIIEPVILVVMGILVGTIAVSMFMPLFDLTAMTQAR